jgi:ubiquinone/menaquinone biosynthesis C-methylase UbiE
MRVLDLGCGAGDVSILAATLVGSSGSVVGVDRSAEAIAGATRRANATGMTQIQFQVSELGRVWLGPTVRRHYRAVRFAVSR